MDVLKSFDWADKDLVIPPVLTVCVMAYLCEIAAWVLGDRKCGLVFEKVGSIHRNPSMERIV